MESKPTGSVNEGSVVSGGLTERDLVLGKRVMRMGALLCAAAFVACLGIAAYTFQNVAIETRMPYSGRFAPNGIPLPMALSAVPLALIVIGRPGGSRAHHMNKKSRVVYSVLLSGMVVAAVWGQWIVAELLLIEGGALPR